MKSLFSHHIEKRIKETSELLDKLNIDYLYIESGFPPYYFMDDQTTLFKPNPYFNFFCPDQGQGHLLKLDRSGKKPQLFYYIPDDFWHETNSLKGDFWESFFNICTFNSVEKAWQEAQSPGKSNFIISPNPKLALKNSCQLASDELIGEINWIRTHKTKYEVECIRSANRTAAKGHKKAKELFFQGATEHEIFMEYLIASDQKEGDLPYNSIVAFDNNASTLHYQLPKKSGRGSTFLIDAGARHFGYCSDITRTYYTENAHSVFKTIHRLLEQGQKKLCDSVKSNVDYVDIHRSSYELVADILIEVGIYKDTKERALGDNIPFSFYPHGIGHPIGLQVHDVGGKQKDSSGKAVLQPEQFPYLRTLRKIKENDVLTIEPGFYFIPMLLEKLKATKSASSLINWNLVEELVSCGGIRIEDNVWAKNECSENLTRPFVD